MIVSFIEDFATWQNNEVDVDLATLVDDIKFENIFGMKFDGTQGQDLEDVNEEIDLNPLNNLNKLPMALQLELMWLSNHKFQTIDIEAP